MSNSITRIIFDKQKVEFSDTELTFSIGHIKSRNVSAVYFVMNLYDFEENLIHQYISDRWIIGQAYVRKHTTFTIPQEIINKAFYMQMELNAVGVSSENPLYFNEVMLNEGEYKKYHDNSKKKKSIKIKFNKSSYANLYNEDGKFLQVIRPAQGDIFTNKITASEVTVLAPHLEDEEYEDSPVNLFFEYINQREQRVDVLR